MTIGIYKIRNIINNKVYIGSSRNGVHKRRVNHKSLLNRKKHGNRYLQRSWDKYGKDAFEFTIIEECNQDIMVIREDFWINYYDSMNPLKGYNIEYAANHTQSKETRQKISDALTGRVFSEETKQKFRESHLGKKLGYKRILTDEWKENLSKSHMGIRPSEETKKKMSDIKTGKHHSEETKRKISDTLKLKSTLKQQLPLVSNS